MLKILRRKGFAKKVLWVIAVVIIISFGFFGTAGVMQNSKHLDYAGKIFGEKVSFNEFEKSYLHTRNQAILRYGEEFYKIEQFLNMNAETWDRLILIHEAKKRNIRISNEELVKTIEQFPSFQRDGQFDALLYNNVLRYVFRCKPRDFEEGMRETLLFAKLFDQATASTTMSDEEILDAYKKQKDKVQISYVTFTAEDYKNEVVLNDQEIQEYYEKNKNNFSVPLTINIEYLSLPYTENMPPEDKHKIQDKMDIASEELKTTPDLTAVGKKYGIELQESGFFSQEQPNLKIGWSYELLQKAFELQPGQISDPIETPEGSYILRNKEIHPAHIPLFNEIQDKIKETLVLNKAKEIAKKKAADQLKLIQENLSSNPNKKFNAVVTEYNLKIEQTPFFARGEYLPNIGISKDFQAMAFNLDDKNNISQPLEVSKGFSILHLDGREPLNQETYLKEKDQFTQTLLNEKKSAVFNDFISLLRIKANLQDNISKTKTSPKPS